MELDSFEFPLEYDNVICIVVDIIVAKVLLVIMTLFNKFAMLSFHSFAGSYRLFTMLRSRFVIPLCLVAIVINYSTLSYGEMLVYSEIYFKIMASCFIEWRSIKHCYFTGLQVMFCMLDRSCRRKVYIYVWDLGFTSFKDSNQIIGTK